MVASPGHPELNVEKKKFLKRCGLIESERSEHTVVLSLRFYYIYILIPWLNVVPVENV